MSDALTLLSNIITSNIGAVQKAYAAHDIPIPSLDVPDNATASDPLAADPDVVQAVNLIIAAAGQLIATVRAPVLSVLDASAAHHTSAAIGTANDLNLTEILREAGPKGLHADEIGKRAGVDSQKIARTLRYLSSRHIYREITPNVFANNRISAATDTGKSVKEIQANPDDKHENTSGIAAILGHITDESAKSSVYLSDYLTPSPNSDVIPGSSTSHTDTPFSLGFRSNLPLFEFLEQPHEVKRLKRFGWAMKGTVSLLNTSTAGSVSGDVLNAFPWATLPPSSIVVDVGGGVGSKTLLLARAFPKLRYVIQDRAPVLGDAEIFWKAEHPTALSSGLVSFVKHDFFTSQPALPSHLSGTPSVFFMRFIAHDWPDDYVRTIITHLRAAADSKTKLVLVEHVVPYATVDGSAAENAESKAEIDAIPGANLPAAPAPLLANLGLVSMPVYAWDFQVMTVLNALERTVSQFVDLVRGTGWKLEYIKRGGGASGHGALAVLVFGTV